MLSDAAKKVLDGIPALIKSYGAAADKAREHYITMGPARFLDEVINKSRDYGTKPETGLRATEVAENMKQNREEAERIIAGYLGMM